MIQNSSMLVDLNISVWLGRKMDRMEEQLEKLVALANQGRGGFWVGMSIMSAASAAAGYLMSWFSKH